MNSILTLAAKDLRLLVRDTRSAIILLLMPLSFVVVLGLAAGESFGQKTDDRLRLSVVVEDDGRIDGPPSAFPGVPWSEVFLRDLSGSADIRIEAIPDRATAERLIRDSKRSAVLIFEKDFSRRVHSCSFLSVAEPPDPEPLNPLYRDGIDIDRLGITLLRDPTQQVAASIIEQVAQVTMLRVVIPWMIGRAFERVGDEKFMDQMSKDFPLMGLLPGRVKKDLGPLVQQTIGKLFSRYNFTAKSWAGLTRAETRTGDSVAVSTFESEPSGGLIPRGAKRWQVLVPSLTVMFMFFLVLTCGWLFVAERRQGTLVRLRAAPLSRTAILLGKLIPCLLVSMFQGMFLMVAGYLIFGMSWGTEAWAIPLVVASVSFAAMGLALLIAGLARTETQVAIYGTLLVLLLAGVSGSLMPRDLMPESMKRVSYITPHAWGLDAFNQLLTNPAPNLAIVGTACAALLGFGLVFLVLAWLLTRLE